MEWEQLSNMIDEIFGISSNGEEREEQELEQEEEQEQEASTEQPEADPREERMREFIERQQERSGAAALEDPEERNREAMERAEGRLPEREERRRQQNQRKNHMLQKLAEMKRKQWEQDQDRAGQKKQKDRHYNSFPLYEFSYGVHDPTTGDKKEQWEKRVGDHVKGKYTLDQPDGTKRVVEYEADDKNGFEAVVKEIDRIDERNRGDVRWGHSDAQVAQSYSKLKKID
uniref:Uncharacterized protein n=1 Tax=Anopheles farauti TaxID=69004 RepID=A0A182QPG1_9DIPT